MEPVSSQAPPLPINSPFKFLFFKYFFRRSVISNSPLFDGFSFFEYSTTLLSKKYKPVIAKFEIFFLVFRLYLKSYFFYLP